MCEQAQVMNSNLLNDQQVLEDSVHRANYGFVSDCSHGSNDQANASFSDFPPESCLSGIHLNSAVATTQNSTGPIPKAARPLPTLIAADH